jgi:hypothetical protein
MFVLIRIEPRGREFVAGMTGIESRIKRSNISSI